MQSLVKNILHLTVHLGGGVGHVVLNYLDKVKYNSKYTHKIASLDYINSSAKNRLNDIDIIYKDNLSKEYEVLISMISCTDIILIHWWNHPLMYEFLVKYSLPECRVIMWSHISGFYAPANFVKPLFDYSDRFIFTTPVSYDVDLIKELPGNHKNKLGSVWSTGGLEHVKTIKSKEHRNFNVGYLGTVDYSKMHKDFLNMSDSIDIDDIMFIVCGGDDEKNIKKYSKLKGIEDKFDFLGKVTDIGKYLAIFDVFGYPLSPYHYGTCDQVLAEAMACGVVPVVFDNPMEKYMVKNGKTGIVVKDKAEYKKAVERLYSNSNLRNKLANNAKKEAFQRFSLDKMINEWENIFDDCLKVRKTEKMWSGKYKGMTSTPFQIFIESTGELGKLFENTMLENNADDTNKLIEMMLVTNLWHSKSKGTLNHYLVFFQDEELKNLKEVIEFECNLKLKKRN